MNRENHDVSGVKLHIESKGIAGQSNLSFS